MLTDDGSSITAKLAQSLQAQRWKVVVLSFPESVIARSPLPEGLDRVVLTDLSENHLQQQLTAITHRCGAIAGFIHLNPVTTPQEPAILKHVFLIAKHLKESLNRAASEGERSFFLTVARLDGSLGLAGKINFGAIGGGLFGLAKTLNQEWQQVFCRGIDLSPDIEIEQAVNHIKAELHDPNRLLTEVGYGEQGRVTLTTTPLPHSSTPPLPHSPTPPIFLVTGGAKGITAQCTIALAKQLQCKFILLGRSDNSSKEPEWAKDCFGEALLKKRIVEYLQAQGEKPTPAAVQKIYNSITSKREITATLDAIARAGGEAEYLSVDVTDTAALREKLAPIVARWGAIAGIIHGAGNLADKRIEKKTERDFDTVYAAKVQGLENLLQCVPIDQIKYLVLFSSVVGFYGNVGQADYAIANEILNKSAYLIKQANPQCHAVAINWGPWDSGMVTPELKQYFAQRNVETIPIAVGSQLLVEELKPENSDVVQVVIGSPLIPEAVDLNSSLKNYRIHRQLFLDSNPFLHDHVIANRPVLPAACALSWITNTCEQIYPGYKCFGVSNYKVLKGIVFNESLASSYTLDLKEIAKTSQSEIEFSAKIWSKKAGKIQYHFSCQLKLMRSVPPSPIYAELNLESDEKISLHKQFYQEGLSSLFHGPCFQGIQSVLNIQREKFTTQCLLPNVGEIQQGQFSVQTINPYILDVQIQSLWIWTQHFCQQACLPSEIKSAEIFAPVNFDETFYISGSIKSKTDSSVLADLIIHNKQGEVYARIIGAKGTILPLEKVNQG